MGQGDKVSVVEQLIGAEQDTEIGKVKDQLRRELSQLRADDEEDLDARLAAVREKYTRLIEDLRAVGDAELVGLAERLANAKAEQITGDFNDRRLRDAEQEVNDLLEVRRLRLERINFERENGLIGVDLAGTQVKQTLDEIDPKLKDLIDDAIALAKALGDTAAVWP